MSLQSSFIISRLIKHPQNEQIKHNESNVETTLFNSLTHSPISSSICWKNLTLISVKLFLVSYWHLHTISFLNLIYSARVYELAKLVLISNSSLGNSYGVTSIWAVLINFYFKFLKNNKLGTKIDYSFIISLVNVLDIKRRGNTFSYYIPKYSNVLT